MNRNYKLWTQALRSGQFPQSRFWLQGKLGYCCLGVACEVYEAYTKDMLPRDKYGYFTETLLRRRFDVVRNWLSLTTHDGLYYDRGKETSLAWLNDTGLNFAVIADVIDSRPKGLFYEEEKTYLPLAWMQTSHSAKVVGV